LVIARRVLFAYPIFAVVALISFVSSEAHWSKVGFLAAGLLYPIVYFVCLDLAIALQGGRKEAALKISGMPLWYLAIVAAFGMAALIIDELRAKSPTRRQSQRREQSRRVRPKVH
jgi:hypothetical protein